MRIAYDRSNDLLVADLGESRKNVSLAIFSLSGTECVSRTYTDVNGFNESLSDLSPAMYICRVKADDESSVDKICK